MKEASTLLQVAGICPTQHKEIVSQAGRLAVDPHRTRLALDDIEWWDRLTRLAELRKAGQ